MEDKNKDVPYTVYEAAQARSDRRFKLMWWLVVVIFVALLGTNGAWLYHESQFKDEVTESYEATTNEGGTAIAYGSGDITVNGEGKIHEDNKTSAENGR